MEQALLVSKSYMVNTQHLNTKLEVESPAVHNYLTTLQGVISRMASNCANCKTWCVSIVSAILVLIADKGKPDYAFIALIPVTLFCFLDAYYLAQEKAFRDIYNNFVYNLVNNNATISNLFLLRPIQGFRINQSIGEAVTSFAIYPFYGILAGTLIIARFFIIK
jgi:hypothetical protein